MIVVTTRLASLSIPADMVETHNDNTNTVCRVSLNGHDCCATCNALEHFIRRHWDITEDVPIEVTP